MLLKYKIILIFKVFCFIIASLTIISALLFFVWSYFFEKPPQCAENISFIRAKTLVLESLINKGYSKSDADSFIVKSVTRSVEDQWPTYFVRVNGVKSGIATDLIAIGNGCGVSEILNITSNK